jgi:TolB-like protein
MQDRELTANEKVQTQAQVLGQVSVEFHSWQFFHIPNKNRIKTKAYQELMKAAQLQYAGNIEIRNIQMTGGWSGLQVLNILGNAAGGVGMVFGTVTLAYPPVGVPFLVGGVGVFGLSGNTQKITATGDVILFDGGAETPRTNRNMEVALNNAAKTLTETIPADTTIAILSVYSTDSGIADYVIDALEYRFFNAKKFNLVDRRRLEQIRREQNFQMSGDVDDSSAVSIGSMLGASIVITGSVSGSGASQRLTLRALDVSTARIITMAMELF